MSGTKKQTNGRSLATSGDALAGEHFGRTAAAWERFAAGADTVQGVRPEILMSWYRCREEYEVDPHLDRAPAAAEVSAHSIEHDVAFTELGGAAASAAREVDDGGLVTVADPEGRILTSWGTRRNLHHAADSNLAPWYTWSEWASGTNGMGTALESHRPVMVRGPEHWCQGFHAWTCAGVAVRDVVTRDPLAVLNISRWKTPLPDTALPWLRKVAAATETKLRQRARHSGTLLTAAFADARVASSTPIAAVDPAGNLVLANNEAATLLGVPAHTPAHDPTQRWASQLPELPHLARRAIERARQDPRWTGSTRISVPFAGTPTSVAIHPVLTGAQVVGLLLIFESPDGHATFGPLPGEPLPDSAYPHFPSSRVIATGENRWILLEPREIRFAEADRNNVWLTSDRGKLQAAARGLDNLERQLEGRGFLRVHRRFLVNLNRVREIEQGFNGALSLVTDTRVHETVPVARRHAPLLRQAIGL